MKMRIDGQARAARPDISVLLKAPAGSGKTSALVGRLLHLLSAGTKPSDTAAITFTEKAAQEMKERLFKSLSKLESSRFTAKEALELSPEDMSRPLVLTMEEILSALLREPDSLSIGTIHSFLLDLLRKNPLDAGLPADFSVLPDTGLLLRREAAVDEVIKRIERGELQDEYEVFYRAGYDSVRKLRKLIAFAIEKRQMVMRAQGKSLGLGKEAERIASMVKEMVGSGNVQSLAMQALMLIPELLDEPEIISLRKLSELKNTDSLPDIFEGIKSLFYTVDGAALANIPPAKTKFKEAYGKEAQTKRALWEEVYPKLRSSFSALACLYDTRVSLWAKDAFLSLATLAGEVYRDMCLRDGAIDFDDIEIYALKLLSSRPDIKLPRHLLVDEFQDTSQIQWDLMNKIAAEQFSGEGVEGLDSPTFFAVGDVNQSIYRFRKAEPRLMKDLRALMEGHIAPERRDFPELDINFRSAPEIIRFTDEVFTPLLGDDYKAGRGNRETNGSVKLRLAPDEPAALAEEVINALALDVEVNGQTRPAGLGDMAVLIQSRARLKDYERALLAHDIPFQVIGGTGFFRQDEVLSILAVLKYLENPLDTFSLRMALKSPLFNIPEGRIPPLADNPMAEVSRIAPSASELFERWSEAARNLPLSELVGDVIKSSSAYERFGQTGGAQAIFNIDKFLRLSREFGRSTGGGDGRPTGCGLHDFIEWIRDYRKNEDLPSAATGRPVSEAGGGSGIQYLTIMTIHSAKGLEFPVVFLPGMGGANSRKDAEAVLFGPDEEGFQAFAVRTDSLLQQNMEYQALKDREAAERTKERMRLFYVAATRARDHLVMLSDTKRPGPDSFLKMLLDREVRKAPPPECLMPEGFLEGVSEYDYPALIPSGHMPVPGSSPACPRHDQKRDGTALLVGPGALPSTGTCPVGLLGAVPSPENLAPLPDIPGVRFISPSGLVNHDLIKDYSLLPSPPAGEGGPKGRVGAGEVTGKLVHEALESYGRTGSYSIRSCRSFNQASKSEAGDAEKIMLNLLSMPQVEELLTPCSGRFFELPLLIRNGDEIVYGFADLVIVSDGKAKVIDFKTGISGISDDICIQAYRPQLEAYAEAVRAAFGVREVEKYLLIAETGVLLPV